MSLLAMRRRIHVIASYEEEGLKHGLAGEGVGGKA